MNRVQIIRNANGEEEFAVIPWDEYERLRAGSDEDAMLIAAGNAARGDEKFPAEIAKRLVGGENALKVIREWRGLTQQQLSAKSNVANQYISQIERGLRNVGRVVAKRLAPALDVSPDILMD